MSPVTWGEALRGLTEFVEARQQAAQDEPPKRRRTGRPKTHGQAGAPYTKRMAQILEMLSVPLTYSQIAGRLPGAPIKESVKKHVHKLVLAGEVVEYPTRGQEKSFIRRIANAAQ